MGGPNFASVMSHATGDDGDYIKLEGGDQSQQQQLTSCESQQGSPWLVWPVFAFSNLAGAMSGPVILLMQNVNSISMAGWRHQVTSLVLLPGFIYESIRMEASTRRKFLSLPSLSLHFLCSLSLAIYRTSLPHCLFLMNTTPVFVALFVKFTGGTLHPLELGGICLSLLGVGVFAIGTASQSGDNSSHLGDFFAILAAIFGTIYVILVKSLRSWMPLFICQFPVAISCMIILGAGGVIFGFLAGTDAALATGPFAWLSKEYWWQTVWLGVVPGVFGQLGYSYVLKYSAPLVMPTGFSIQPIIGSVFGWLIGQTAVPGAWTWIGGVVILSGTTVVNIASTLNKKTAEEA